MCVCVCVFVCVCMRDGITTPHFGLTGNRLHQAITHPYYLLFTTDPATTVTIVIYSIGQYHVVSFYLAT